MIMLCTNKYNRIGQDLNKIIVPLNPGKYLHFYLFGYV